SPRWRCTAGSRRPRSIWITPATGAIWTLSRTRRGRFISTSRCRTRSASAAPTPHSCSRGRRTGARARTSTGGHAEGNTRRAMRWVIANDHAGLPLKREVLRVFEALGISVEDLGTNAPESVDYPTYAHALAEGISSGRFDRGVLVCGTG